jgi:YidC/Oxa1 family membrane protein insertase
MTSPRNFLLIALLFIGYLLWMQWQEDYNKAPSTNTSAGVSSGAAVAPPASNSGSDAAAPAALHRGRKPAS